MLAKYFAMRANENYCLWTYGLFYEFTLQSTKQGPGRLLITGKIPLGTSLFQQCCLLNLGNFLTTLFQRHIFPRKVSLKTRSLEPRHVN